MIEKNIGKITNFLLLRVAFFCVSLLLSAIIFAPYNIYNGLIYFIVPSAITFFAILFIYIKRNKLELLNSYMTMFVILAACYWFLTVVGANNRTTSLNELQQILQEEQELFVAYETAFFVVCKVIVFALVKKLSIGKRKDSTAII